MQIVALTGNIAAGKSAVASGLAERGATVIDADILAREAVARGRPALAAITARWGDKVLRRDGSLDRGVLRDIVFADPAEREALDSIVHPAVERLRNAAIETARRRGETLVICDIPLLFETGLDAGFQTIILVDAPAEVRKERIVRDRGLTAEVAEAMIAAQLPSSDKRSRATYIIDNAGTLDDLEAKIEDLWNSLTDNAPYP